MISRTELPPSNNVSHFTALVHSENHKMMRLLDRLGGEHAQIKDTEVEYRLPLFSDAEAYPDTRAGNVFRAVYKLANFR